MPIDRVWGGINCEGWRLIVFASRELDLCFALSKQLILLLLSTFTSEYCTVKVLNDFIEYALKVWVALG